MSSKSFPGLIPGLESFMEDTDVSVEVSVGEPEEVEASEEAVEAGAEIAEVSEEAESTEEQTEMILMQFEDLAHRYEHVKKYGVDRTFMRLFNSKGELSKALRHSFPSCESFDATGNVRSAESIACMEGFGDALKSVWEFVKNLCKKIGAFFARLFEAVRVRLGNLNSQIGRLRKLNKERTSDVDNLSDVDKKMPDPAEIGAIAKAILAKLTVTNTGIVIAEAPADMAKIGTVVKELTKSETEDEAKIKQYTEGLKEYKKAFDNLKRDLRKMTEDVKTVDVKSVSATDIENLLKTAVDMMQKVDELNKIESESKTALRNAERLADNYAARAVEKDEAAALRKKASALARALNFMSGETAFAVEMYQKVASMAVRAASVRLQYRKKVA